MGSLTAGPTMVVTTAQWLLCLCSIASVTATPIVFPLPSDLLATPFIPKDFCILPPDYGTQGTTTYLEECDSLDQFTTLPKPADNTQKVGTHSLVCCPRKIHKDDFICFPTDAWCPIYQPPPPLNITTETPRIPQQLVTMANRTCYNTTLRDGSGKIL